MSMYITSTNATARLGSLFAQFYNLETKPDEFANDVERAEGEVNMFVGRRYILPPSTSEASAVTRELALDLFEEQAWTRGGAGSTVPEKVKDKAARARKLLEQISKGVAKFVGATEQEAPGGAATAVAVSSGEDATMTKDSLTGF